MFAHIPFWKCKERVCQAASHLVKQLRVANQQMEAKLLTVMLRTRLWRCRCRSCNFSLGTWIFQP